MIGLQTCRKLLIEGEASVRSDKVIVAQNLGKRYGRFWALRHATFEIERGKVVGFLGPNGAGKTTLLRILAVYLPATEGSLRIFGLDPLEDAIQIHKRLGYMPEANPLYPEMRVDEYLFFRGRLKGLFGGRLRDQVDRVVEQCDLGSVRRKLIGTLSKGFRQRVGLADTLLHEPDLIILDEPTIGLDPVQVRSFRKLLRGLAGERTILFSSHIVSEVEQLCDEVFVVLEGRVVQLDRSKATANGSGRKAAVTFEFQAPKDQVVEVIRKLGCLISFEVDEVGLNVIRGRIVASCNGQELRLELARLAKLHGWLVTELFEQLPSLEEAFVAYAESYRGVEFARRDNR